MLQRDIKNRIGAHDFADFIQRDLMHFTGGGQTIFFHELIDDRHGKNIISHFRERHGHGGKITISAPDIGALIERWQDEN